jgi:hypothetical protein
MSEKEILKPASKLLISELRKRDIALKPTISYQLISAAYGFWSHESVAEYGLPFEAFNTRHYFGAQPQFHQDLLCDRITKLLGQPEERSRDITQLIIDLLTHHYPLRVQALRVLYDPKYDHSRAMIFRIINKNEGEQSPLASAAIATHQLPLLPAMSISDNLQLMRTKTMFDDEQPITVDDFIQQAPSWIWIYPSPLLKEAFPSLADSAFRKDRVQDTWGVSDIKPQTEIGVGFVLLQKRPPVFDQEVLSIVSGRYVLDAKGTSPKWSPVNVVCKSREDVSRFREPSLRELLGHPVDQLPLLRYCQVCSDLQANAHDGTTIIHCRCSALGGAQ